MHIRILSSIFVILLIGKSQSVAAGQPDEPMNIAKSTSAKATLAIANTTPSKPPLDVRLAHWASMALAGLVAVDGLWGVCKIIFNTNRWETVKSAPHDPHPFLRMPHKVIKTETIRKLVNVSKPNQRLNLKRYRDLHQQVYTSTTLHSLQQHTKRVVTGTWKDFNFDIDECFEQLQNCDFQNVTAIQLFTKRPEKDSAPTDFAFVFQETLPGGKPKISALHYQPQPWQKIEINRLPYIIRASIAHALTFISSAALVSWMYKNPPAAGPNSTKRAAGFTIAGLGIGAAGAVTHWKGSITYIHPLVPFLTAASLLLRGYAEWRYRSNTSKVAAAHK
jgi:hypothetical protein